MALESVFVVQFRAPSMSSAASFAGRAEHLMSGQSADFLTSQELFEFFEQVMKEQVVRTCIRETERRRPKSKR